MEKCRFAITIFALLTPHKGKPTDTEVLFYNKIDQKFVLVPNEIMFNKTVADIISSAESYYFDIVPIKLKLMMPEEIASKIVQVKPYYLFFKFIVEKLMQLKENNNKEPAEIAKELAEYYINELKISVWEHYDLFIQELGLERMENTMKKHL